MQMIWILFVALWEFSLANILDGGAFEAAFQGKCGPSSPCVQLCVELHDGTFECQCQSGYRLLVDGYSCVELTNITFSEDSEEEWVRTNRVIERDLRKAPSSLEQKVAPSSSDRSESIIKQITTQSPNYENKFPSNGKDEFMTSSYVKKDILSSSENDINGEEDDDDDDDEDSDESDEDDISDELKSKDEVPSTAALQSQIQSQNIDDDGGEVDDNDGDAEEDDFLLHPTPSKDYISLIHSNKDKDSLLLDSNSFTNTIKFNSIDIDNTNNNIRSYNKDSLRASTSNVNQNDTGGTPGGGGGGGGSDASESPAVAIENCPLKCNRGICSRELSEEAGLEQRLAGYRCLCPMGTRGSFCEIEDVAEEGGGYNSGLFRGQSWVAFPVLHDAYMSDQISLEFRPESPSGILLLTGERDDLSGDFLALYLHDGFLEFRFDCGSGSGMVRSSHPVLLQQWNRASIVRRRWDGWMQLNDGPFTQGRSKGLFSRITFRQPVFIGGAGNITFNSFITTQNNFDEEGPADDKEKDVGAEGEAIINGMKSDYGESTTAPSSTTSFTPESNSKLSSSSNMDVSSTTTATGVDGGSDSDSATTALPILRKTGGFRGCIRNLVINDRAYRFGLEPAGDSLQGFDIESCNDQGVCDLVRCQHGGQCIVQKDENPTCLCPLGFTGPLCETPLDLQIPSFNGSSYLKYGGLGLSRVLSWLELEVVVKPDSMDGLILYNGYKTDGMGDFIALSIDQGYLEFAMDLGTGTAIIRSDYPVTLGEWHRIQVSRTSRLISMRIDNQSPLMALTPGAFTQLSLPHNLFLGGIPDPLWLSPKVKVHGGFSGCIQKLVINEKPLRIMGSAMSGVNLENCAHPCLRNPCDHGGDCIPQLDTFKCHCPLGYRDPYCQTRMDKEDVISAPRFIGDSYLRFTHPKIIKRVSGWRLNLSFRLRTSLSRGLILWAGRKWMTSASDFISVGLRNGFVTVSFSLGSGQTTIAYNLTSVHDGQWHRVHLIRNEQEASLSVDNGPPVTGVAPGKLRQLNINDGLYIGGLEDPRHQSMNKYTEGLVGCLTDLILGSDFRVSLLKEASEGRNVDYCD